MVNPSNITLFVQAKGTEREKYFPFAKIGIKTRLVIRAGNEKIPTYMTNIPHILNIGGIIWAKGSFKGVNLFADEIIY